VVRRFRLNTEKKVIAILISFIVCLTLAGYAFANPGAVLQAGGKYLGTSADTKPTGVATGTLFIENDTHRIFIFDQGSWHIVNPATVGVIHAMAMGTVTGIPINGTGLPGVEKFVVAHNMGKAPDVVELTLTNPTATDFQAICWWQPNSTDPTTYFDLYVYVIQASQVAGATVDVNWVAYNYSS